MYSPPIKIELSDSNQNRCHNCNECYRLSLGEEKLTIFDVVELLRHATHARAGPSRALLESKSPILMSRL